MIIPRKMFMNEKLNGIAPRDQATATKQNRKSVCTTNRPNVMVAGLMLNSFAENLAIASMTGANSMAATIIIMARAICVSAAEFCMDSDFNLLLKRNIHPISLETSRELNANYFKQTEVQKCEIRLGNRF